MSLFFFLLMSKSAALEMRILKSSFCTFIGHLRACRWSANSTLTQSRERDSLSGTSEYGTVWTGVIPEPGIRRSRELRVASGETFCSHPSTVSTAHRFRHRRNGTPCTRGFFLYGLLCYASTHAAHVILIYVHIMGRQADLLRNRPLTRVK